MVIVSLALVLFTLGGSFFRYLTTPNPIEVTQSGAIAAATTFVPATSPFSISLLTSPEVLFALNQANAPVSPADNAPRGQQASSEAQPLKQTLKQNLLAVTGLDYDQDLLPWLGNEITFSLTATDLDFDQANGAQPGYLLVAAISPQRQREAREFLQLLWQQRTLAGTRLQSQQMSGVQMLYGDGLNTVTAASALVGDRFIVFANDVRVLRRSIRAAQSAMNLAQNRTYRNTVAQLSEERVGLAYFNSDLLGGEVSNPGMATHRMHTAMSMELAPGGLVARLRRSDGSAVFGSSAMRGPAAAMKFVPAESAWAIASTDLTQLLKSPKAVGLTPKELPRFLSLGQPWDEPAAYDAMLPTVLSEWAWASNDYALTKVDNDWVLSVARDEAGMAQLDAAAQQKGYSAVPVALDEDDEDGDGEVDDEGTEAIAWTRFKAKQTKQNPSYRTSSSRLETEVLGLHLQQGNYEIFASSLGAMSQALSAPGRSLHDSAQFAQAVKVLPNPNHGYLYLNKAKAAELIRRQVPAAQRIIKATDPLFSYVRSLSATQSRTQDGETVSLFIQMSR
ncbi:MAG: DUF3352 domain-containing protein [Phormidesmis sp.]